MKNNLKFTCLLASLLLVINPVYAQSFVGDSVMNPNNNTSTSNVTTPSGNIAYPSYTSSNQNDIQYDTCPSGFTHNGSSQYPRQIRTLTNYYLGGNYVGQSASAWYDTDASCNAIEYQTIGCEVNYTGQRYQSRTASTRDGNSYDYSAWNTYSSSCVYNPPKKPGVMSGNIESVRGVTFGAGESPQVGATLDYGNAALRCTSGYPSSGGDAGAAVYPSSWSVYALGQNTQYGGGDSGTLAACSMSNGNRTATLFGNCDSTSGGDAGVCQSATVKVNITNVDGCTVYVQSTGRWTKNYSYNICQ